MKSKYELEYTINSPTRLLFERLSTPEGLSEWFADNVTVDGGIFTFFWAKTEGTCFNKYVLPTINVTQIIKEDATFSFNKSEK